MDVYVDESGDLGFSPKATKFFIIAYLACDSSINIRTNMKRLLKTMRKKKQYHSKQSELKFCRMDDYCKKTVLETIVKSDVNLGVIVIEKRYVKLDLRDKLPVLYNYLVVHNVISALLPSLEAGQKIHIIFDKSLSRSRIIEFNSYVREKASYLSYIMGNKLSSDCILSDHIDSEIEPCLQAVDSVAGAYFHKYEEGEDSYVNIIRDITSFNYLWRK